MKKTVWRISVGRYGIVVLAVLALGLGACSDDERTGQDGGGLDAETVDGGLDGSGRVDAQADAEPIEVVSEVQSIPVSPSPPNPVSEESAPPETEQIAVIRYRAVNGTKPVQAIVIGYPGAQLGAGSYALLAKNLIRESKGAIEFWAYERRSNLLEDRVGLDAAMVQGDPSIATGYYSGQQEVDGQSFQGFLDSHDPSFMSEWGLALEMEDFKEVVEMIPEQERKKHVVLLGFSLGAPVVSQYAAWDFDGRKGADDLAALVMLDGGGLKPSISETDYHQTGCYDSLGLRVGLDELRASGPYLQEFQLGSGLWAALEILGMGASGEYGDPAAEMEDPYLSDLMAVFLYKSGLHFTWKAGLGVLVDEAYSPVLVMRAGLGRITGGPVETYINYAAGAQLIRPADTSVVYSWLDYDEVTPRERSYLPEMAKLLYEGVTGGFEWYSPVRLNLDVCAVDGLDVVPSEEDYRWNLGLRVTRNAEMDAPVFFFFAEYGELHDMGIVTAYKDSLPPVGEGRPNEGAERDPSLPVSQSGFVLVRAPRYRHMDVILAASDAGQEYLYGPLTDFILANTEGTIDATMDSP